MGLKKRLLMLGITCGIVLFSITPPLLADVAVGTSYRLESFTTGTGTGMRDSANYSVDYSVGQSLAGGTLGGSSYTTETGYQMSYATTPEPPDHGAAVDMDITSRTYVQDAVSSQSIESTLVAAVNDVITIGIVAQNVENLDTYQVEVHFDPTQLAFLAGYEDNALGGITNLLKKNGGSTIWMGATQTTPGVVSIANSLIGSDPAIAPEGSGILALLQFTVLQSSETNDISLNNVHFVNDTGRDFTVANLAGGSVVAEIPPVPGDVDGNTNVELQDAIVSLKVVTGAGEGDLNLQADVNADQRIGIEEVIYILEEVAQP